MRWKVVVCVGCVAPLAGCNLAYYAGRNLRNEPAVYATQQKLHRRLEAEGRAALRAYERNCPGGRVSRAFADGFADGYADQIDNGGPPQPPVPPVEYRRHANDFTPEGQARARDYLAGFKAGAEVACATGRRADLLVPVILPAPQPERPLNITRPPSGPPAGPGCPPGHLPPAGPAPVTPATPPGAVPPPVVPVVPPPPAPTPPEPAPPPAALPPVDPPGVKPSGGTADPPPDPEPDPDPDDGPVRVPAPALPPVKAPPPPAPAAPLPK